MTTLPHRVWFHLSNAFVAAALLSALQIYLRQSFADQQPALLRLIALNLVAWAPWLPIAAAALMVLGRFPLIPAERPSALAIHGLCSLVAAGLFLTYLSFFRLITLGQPLDWASLSTNFALEVGDFFLVCLLLYGAIVAVGSLWLDRNGQQPLAAPAEVAPRLEVRSHGRTRYVDAEEIDWISSEGSYVGLHLGTQTVLMRASMKEMAERLSEFDFIRIHRSAIVNRRRVVARRSRPRGDAELELRDGTILRMSRRYRTDITLH